MMNPRETELERVLKEALTLSEEERKKRYWWQVPRADTFEAKLAAFFTPSARVAMLKWAWILSLLMLVMGYIIIFFKLFPEKCPL
ncbi:MAG: hypothetical protein QXL78_04960 [Methanocellales archaeon]